MSKALLIIYGPTDGTEMIRVASRLNGGALSPSVYFYANYAVLSDRLDMSLLRDVPCYDAQGLIRRVEESEGDAWNADGGAVAPPPVNRSLKGRVIGALRTLPPPVKSVLRSLYNSYRKMTSARWNLGRHNALSEWIRLKGELAECRRILAAISPDLLILPLESVGHHSATLAFAARERGIPVVVVPYSVPVNVGEIAERWYPDEAYWRRGYVNGWIARAYPEWVKKYRGRELLRLRWYEIVARRWLGLAPDEPWDAGGMQFSHMIAVENEAMLKYYRKERFPEDKLRVTGTMVDDLLARGLAQAPERTKELYQELGLDESKPILLSSMPPDFVERSECVFETYEELVEFWMSVIGAMDGYNVLVRLHPSLSYKDFEPHEKRWGVRLVRNDTAHLMPLCDLFVTSISATIRWAIACGIPVVNYDVYQFRYEDYVDAKGVLTLEGREAFQETLRKLNCGGKFRMQLRERQQSCKANWGVLDGRAGERMLDMFTAALGRGARNESHLG